MTSSQWSDSPGAAVDLAGLHDLLWAIRRDPVLAGRVDTEPQAIAATFDVEPEIVALVVRRDVDRLHRLGVNPYLLFFASLALGVDRASYYEALRGADAHD